MTAGSVDVVPARAPARAPVLVLGLGNLLLSDDAAGLHLEAALKLERGASPQVEFVDGGTQGLALLDYLSNRRAVLVLDAVGLGAEPGSVHVLRGPAIDGLRVQRATTAHEGNALELLAVARLLGDEAAESGVMGGEPAIVATGIGLSPEVTAGLGEAMERARAVLDWVRRRRERAGPDRGPEPANARQPLLAKPSGWRCRPMGRQDGSIDFKLQTCVNPSLAELGYNVHCFCFQDSPRRAHSIAAQGGINAAKNYHNDGDSIYRLFYDTVKGGDFRARESNVYRLAGVSLNIIDQCVGQGVPFAREYSGYLDNRSFGGAQVSRTFYSRGQTGQQLLLGAYQALERQIGLGAVKMTPRTEMLDLIVVDGRARGIVTRDLISGKIESHFADAVVLGTGGYGNVYSLSTNAKGCNATAIWRAHRRGALFANPCFTQIHPTCIPVSGEYQSKLTLMSESLRNDGRVWVLLLWCVLLVLLGVILLCGVLL